MDSLVDPNEFFSSCFGAFANRNTRPEGSDCISATTGSKGQSPGPGTGSGWSLDSLHGGDRTRTTGWSTASSTHNMRPPKGLWLCRALALVRNLDWPEVCSPDEIARLRSLRSISPDSGPRTAARVSGVVRTSIPFADRKEVIAPSSRAPRAGRPLTKRDHCTVLGSRPASDRRRVLVTRFPRVAGTGLRRVLPGKRYGTAALAGKGDLAPGMLC